MPIAAFLTMTAKPGSEAELERRFKDILIDVRNEPGNLMAVTLRDPKRPDQLYEFAIYRDEDAIAAHRIAPHSLAKGPGVRECFSEPRTPVFFETVDWPEGLTINQDE